MRASRASVLVFVLLMTIGNAASLHAALDMFLDFDPDIPGESADKDYREKVGVLAWAWGMANSGTTHLGGGAGAGKANLQDLSLTKYVDKASPNLMLHCANGKHIDKATLFVRKAGTTPTDYLKIELSEVLVTSISSGGSGGEDRLTENVTLNFAQVSLTYTPVINSLPQTGLQYTWNIPNNTGTNADGTVPAPRPVSGLTSTLTYTNGTPFARLTWSSTAGIRYRVWVTDELGSAFQLYGNPIPSAGDGTTSVTVPADAIRKFFRIETLPVQ